MSFTRNIGEEVRRAAGAAGAAGGGSPLETMDAAIIAHCKRANRDASEISCAHLFKLFKG